MVEETRDIKTEIKEIIEELQEKQNTLDLRVDEVVDEAKKRGISEHASREVIEHLIEDNYIHIHHSRGGEDIISRTKYRDYSPAYEEAPEY